MLLYGGKTVRKSFNGRNLQQKRFMLNKNSDPRGLSAPACFYTCKQAKICLQSDFKDIFLKLATNGQSDKAFLLTSEICTQRVVCPCPWAIFMWKNIKNVYKNQNSKRFF